LFHPLENMPIIFILRRR